MNRPAEEIWHVYNEIVLLPDSQKKGLEELQNLLYPIILPELVKYNGEVVKKIKSNILLNDQSPKIFLSIVKTDEKIFNNVVHAFLNTWDVEKIDYWYCLDKTEGKSRSKKKKDWFVVDKKDITTKLMELKPKYWIHLEDGICHIKKNHIEECLENFKTDRIYFREGAEHITKIPKNPDFMNWGESITLSVFK